MNNQVREAKEDLQEGQYAGNIGMLTREAATKSNAIEIPSIELPRGGGALRGIDEKFEVNAANGTSGLTIPLPFSPGRNGFTPDVNLRYNSGGGNSEFGLGWTLESASIQRKTDKRLPRYFEGEEEDVFLLSGAEDLTAMLEEQGAGNWQKVEFQVGDYRIKRYRPRVESSFARIEQIGHPAHGVYWKVTSRSNVTTIYGRSPDARISDPEDSRRIFQWLPEFSFDDKGNWLRFEYKDEDSAKVPDVLFERNRRSGLAPFSNKYLKRIRYANRLPYYPDAARPYDPSAPSDNECFFEVVFDYGEHDQQIPTPAEVDGRDWDYRPDAYSRYRAGFEIRTNRLCKRVLFFHHFKDEASFGENYLVRSLDFDYEPSSINESGRAEVSYLASVTQAGYIRKDDNTYARKTLPPLEFTYQRLSWSSEVHSVDRENLVNAPVGLTNNYQWVDLYGEGIAGILSEQADGWFYKSNKGDVDGDGNVLFSAAALVLARPSFNGLSSGLLSLQDLAANGEKQLVLNAQGMQGYFELTGDRQWRPFTPFAHVANLDLSSSDIKRIDLNGDGQAELLLADESAFIWYAADGKDGYKAAERSAKSLDEEQGPRVVFADQEQSIFFADMTGDGLNDIVRIRNGEVCYWANKGYGRFSARVAMSNAPLFDHPASFNPQFLRLADVSGTGATDIVYLGHNSFRAFLNHSGNSWSEAQEFNAFPSIDARSAIALVDLLGNGTQCIVWSSDLPGQSHAPMRYIDLMNSRKPHLLQSYKNNLGRETSLEYKSSVHYFLQDKRAGRPWATSLPFPVQVVAKLLVEDNVSSLRFSSHYTYHHGYYDHPEREFRGFGMVEQRDSEEYEEWRAAAEGSRLERSEESYQSPMLTKTWYHTGAFLADDRIMEHLEDEYWYEEFKRSFPDTPLTISEPQLPGTKISTAGTILDDTLSDSMSADEWREALRACKGSVLRREVFALDATADNADDAARQRQLTPYSVETRNCRIQILQPRDAQPYAVFQLSESEVLTIHYERQMDDPRIAHSLNLRIDELGNVLESAAVVYGRNPLRANAAAQNLRDRVSDFGDENDPAVLQAAFENAVDNLNAAQQGTRVIVSRNRFSNDVISPEVYRLRAASAIESYEITGLTPAAAIYALGELDGILDDGASTTIAYHAAPSMAVERRLIESVHTLFYADDLSTALPLGQIESKGLAYESYQLAYTPDLLNVLFADKISNPAAAMTAANFVHSQGDVNWWLRSGIIDYIEMGEDAGDAAARFYSPLAYTDPLGAKTEVAYLKDYFLLIESTRDAIGNQIKVERFNLRSLSPSLIRDVNDNLSEVLLDELGLVKAFAILGKDLDGDGLAELDPTDVLTGLEEQSESELSDIQQFLASEDSMDLDQRGRVLLKGAGSRYVYDFDRYRNGAGPALVVSIHREEHHSINPASKLQLRFEYSDGTGTVAMTKMQAEPGLARGLAIQPDDSYSVTEVDTAESDPEGLRWIGSGRTILNNKGNPVKQYEPYFALSPAFESAAELVESGVTLILTYDAPGRLIRTDFPDGTYSHSLMDAWRQRHYDRNDSIADSRWYDERINNLIDDELLAAGKDPAVEKEAAQKAIKHRDTPDEIYLDALGRPVLNMSHNGRDDNGREKLYAAFIALDIEGNVRSVDDARASTVMEYGYDMLGHRLYQKSADAGERWQLNDAAGNPLSRWDSRNHIFSYSYDALHRPTGIYVKGGDDASELLNHRIEKIVYGEGQTDDKTLNLRGRFFARYDQAGKTAFGSYDNKGNVLSSSRRLARDYKRTVDWSGPDPDAGLEAESFTSAAEFDALSRPRRKTHHDGSVTESTYNAAGLLETILVSQAAAPAETIVANINYDEKGQRQHVLYGNGISTTYDYDAATFRLTHLASSKADGEILQDLYYSYDPVGNISSLEDKSVPVVFFNNQKVEARARYTYDPLYRLTEAEGREHAGQAIDFGPEDNWQDQSFLKQYNPGDVMAWRNYRQRYRYDPVGNIERIRHIANQGSWTRNLAYAADSNRLNSADVDGQMYDYSSHNAHGCIARLPHLQLMKWNCKDELRATARQSVLSGSAETTYYVYDAGGRRVRKVTENAASDGAVPDRKDERIYLDGIEIYRKLSGLNKGLERRTLSVEDGRERVAIIDSRNEVDDGTAARSTRYQFGNHLGSVMLETDETARVISYEEYHPYGTSAYQAVDATLAAAAKRYRYIRMERDSENGLNYHGARYYIPWLGRWLSPDPAGLVDGLNLYRFAKNNPIRFVDPLGNDTIDLGLATELDRRWLDGITNTFEDFASDYSGTDREIVRQAIEEADEIRFHLDGIDEDELFKQVDNIDTHVRQHGTVGLDDFIRDNRSFTAYEFYEVLGDEDVLEKTNFFVDGADAPSGRVNNLLNRFDEFRGPRGPRGGGPSGGRGGNNNGGGGRNNGSPRRSSSAAADVAEDATNSRAARRLVSEAAEEGGETLLRRAGRSFFNVVPFLGAAVTLLTYNEADAHNLGSNRVEEAIAGETPIGAARDAAVMIELGGELVGHGISATINVIEERDDTPPPGSSEIDWYNYLYNAFTR